MKLEYDQWLNMLATDDNLKEKWIDKFWKDLSTKRREVKEELFELLYANRHLDFSFEDKYLHFAVSEDNVKLWDKRFYKNIDTYIFVNQKVPQLLKQKNITRYTVQKIVSVLQGMVYCDDVLSKREVQSKPLETKTTEEIMRKRWTWIQLEIPFEDDSKKSCLSGEQLEDLYKEDRDEPWWNR